jgi:phosphatidate cytidylyltransferase
LAPDEQAQPRRRPAPRRRKQPGGGGGGSNVAARVAVAVPAGIVALLCILTSPETLAIFVLIVGAVALHEFYVLSHSVQPIRLAGFLTFVALVGAGLWGDQFQLVAIIAASFAVVFLFSAFTGPRENATFGMAATLFGAFWIGIPLAHALWLQQLPHGEMIIIDVLLGTFIGDTFAMFGGKLFGRTKMAPALSPNKTMEGLAIGMLGAVATVWFAGLYQDWITGQNALLLGLAVAVTAPLGDVFESYIKRDFGVKDSGRAFGAHGGAMDRADAALFVLVVAYYVWFAMAPL